MHVMSLKIQIHHPVNLRTCNSGHKVETMSVWSIWAIIHKLYFIWKLFGCISGIPYVLEFSSWSFESYFIRGRRNKKDLQNLEKSYWASQTVENFKTQLAVLKPFIITHRLLPSFVTFIKNERKYVNFSTLFINDRIEWVNGWMDGWMLRANYIEATFDLSSIEVQNFEIKMLQRALQEKYETSDSYI